MFSVFTGRLFEILNPPGSRSSETGKEGFPVAFVVLGWFVLGWFVLGANGFGAFPAGFVNAAGCFSPPNCSVILDTNEDVVDACPKENPLDVCELFAGVDPKLKLAFSVVFGFSEIFGFSKGFIEPDVGAVGS